MLEKYSVALAVENLLPVLFLTLGLLFIARMLKRKNELLGELAYIASFLIVVGNWLNAIGKLLSATNGSNSVWMKNSLLFLSAPGFVCLAWALWRAKQKHLNAGAVWLLPLFLNGGLLALTAGVRTVKGGQVWLKLLLIVVTVASVVALVQLALQAFRLQRSIVAILFILSLGMSLALTLWGGDVSEAAEWAKQISNTIAQGVFAFAAFSLQKIVSLADLENLP
ncbi:MAG: hypothetical protein ACKVZH_05120 [Blastocatellia bacterium]